MLVVLYEMKKGINNGLVSMKISACTANNYTNYISPTYRSFDFQTITLILYL